MKLFEQGTFVTPYGLSAEEIVARRKRLDENKPDFGNARYIGEGIGDAVSGWLWGKNARRLDKMEGEERARLKDLIMGALGGSSLTGGSYSGSGSYGGSPAYAKPDPLAPQAIADDAMRALDKPLQSPNIEYDPNNPEKLAADAMTILGFQPQYLKYDNVGATRNKPLSPEAEAAFSFLPEMGLEGRVVSGGQDAIGTGGQRTGSTRHDLGGAGDIDFYKDGRRLSTDNPADLPYFREIARRGVGAGFTGMGEGADYMGAGRMHIGYGAPATWGANGDSANTPSWLGQAYAQGVNDYGQPTQARVASNERFSAANNPIGDYANAIASVESDGSGGYQAIGPEVKGDRAYGKYQVMGANIPSWTEKYWGQRLTPEQFLANPEAQDAVFNGEFGSYVEKYGNPQDAASAWFTGKPLAQGGNRSDGYITGNEYVNRFNGAMGMPASGGQRIAQGYGGQGNAAAWAEILSNPFADAGQKAIAQTMLQQSVQAMQPQQPDYKWVDGVGFVDMNRPDPSLMAGNYQGSGTATPNVQSSVMLPDNSGVVKTMRNGDIVVETVGGEVLTGQDAIDFVTTSNDAYVEDQRQINQGRREGTLQGDINLGGEAASAVAAGENAQKAGFAAWEALGTVQQSIPKLQRVIELVDEGANTGTIANQFPALNDATKELRMIQNELGLDVVGAVTFGALSEGELRLALSTALPTNLSGEGLKDWVSRKIEAQTKLAAYYDEQARFLMTSGNTLTGWMDHMAAKGGSPVAGGQPAPQSNPQQQAPMTPEQIKGVISGLSEEERNSFMAMPRDQQLEFVRKRLGAAQ